MKTYPGVLPPRLRPELIFDSEELVLVLIRHREGDVSDDDAVEINLKVGGMGRRGYSRNYGVDQCPVGSSFVFYETIVSFVPSCSTDSRMFGTYDNSRQTINRDFSNSSETQILRSLSKHPFLEVLAGSSTDSLVGLPLSQIRDQSFKKKAFSPKQTLYFSLLLSLKLPEEELGSE